MSDEIEQTTSEGAKPEAQVDWKAEARKWESRAKENLATAKANEDAARRLGDIEQSSKSEQQKLTEQLAALQNQFAQQQAEAKRLSVIAKHGIPADYHELIVGADDAELEARAEKVKALIGSTNQGPFPPKADPSQGAGGVGGKKTTAEQFAEFAAEQFKN